MKVTFFSNFLNHHQLAFCIEMYRLLGENFKFVATEPIHQERIKMGYTDMNTMYPFSLNTYSCQEDYDRGLELGYVSDVVIIGASPKTFIKKRLKENKITFYYSERIFKKGIHHIFNPKLLGSLMFNHILPRNKNNFMLCASAYTAADFRLIGAYIKRTYKWGYFPECKQHNLFDLMAKKPTSIPKLLWVGRFIDWKHPEEAIKVAYTLKEEGYNFTLDIIGIGELEGLLKEKIKEYRLSKVVNVLGSMSPDQVREHMEAANIFLFTSDFNEGWGAVLNEAMNSGCAVVASHAIGSVPFLMKNKENGLIYKNGDFNNLINCVKKLLDDSDLRQELGRRAYSTLIETWNAKEAAHRFIKLSISKIKGEIIQYKDGPCSKAEVISQKYNY